MLCRSFGLLSFILLLSDHCLIESLISKGSSSYSKTYTKGYTKGYIGDRRRGLETQLQQKKRSPVGGDFIELGSSLITLLNLAQEIGSSNNLRFRMAADKLRDQFARSFALRYDLEKSQFLSAALSSIDGDSQLTTGSYVYSFVFQISALVAIRVLLLLFLTNSICLTTVISATGHTSKSCVTVRKQQNYHHYY